MCWWKTKKDVWKRHTCAPAFDQHGCAKMAKNAKVLVLTLENEHYTWVKPPANHNIPRQWLQETVPPDPSVLAGAAKRLSASGALSSRVTPSVRSLQSRPSVGNIEPVKDVNNQVTFKENTARSSVKTPSVHTLKEATDSLPDKGLRVETNVDKSWVVRGAEFKVAPSVHTIQSGQTLLALKSGEQEPSSSSGSKVAGSHVEDVSCHTWTEALRLLQKVQNNINMQNLREGSVGVLQSCLLLCSSLTRDLNDELAKAIEATKVDEDRICIPQTGQVKRKRLWMKQPPPGHLAVEKPPVGVPLKEAYSWKCNLCDYTLSERNKGTFFSRKSRHINKVHPDQKHLVAERRQTYPLIEASDIPFSAHNWTCAKCNLGLPWLPQSQLERSRDAHLKKCAPGYTGKQNFAKLRSGTHKNHVSYRLYARKKTGWHSAEWRAQRRKEAAEKGHDLQSFVPSDTLFKTQPLRFTCHGCKRLQIETDVFRRKPCKPNRYPDAKGWRALRTKATDESMQTLMAIWQWGKKEVRHMENKLRQDRLRGRAKELSRANVQLRSVEQKAWFVQLPEEGVGNQGSEGGWQRDLVEEGVEPNPGPRQRQRSSSELRILQLNVNGRENLWNLGNHLDTYNVDVICLQETHMNQAQSNNFATAMFRKGWVVHAIPTEKRCGVMTMVKKTLRSRILHKLSQDGGQFLATQVGQVTVGNLYAAHHRARTECLAEVFDLIQVWGQWPWVVTGDWNDEPSQSPLAMGLQACGHAICLPPADIGSRWESHRQIDYFISNCSFNTQTLDTHEDRWSDHRAFQGCVRTPSPAEVNEKFEMVPTNKYCPKDPADLFRWTEVLDTGWDRVKEAWGTWLAGWASRVEQTPSEVPRQEKQAMVDQIWREFNFHLEEFLQKQAVQAEQMGVGMRCHKKPQRRKCDLPKIRRVPLVLNRDYPSHSSNKIRVWIRLWGRLCEAERLQQVDCSDFEVKQLWKKIVRCRYFKHGMTAADAATEVQNLLAETQKTRLQAWKKKLRDDSTLVFKWVRQKPASPTINIFDDENDAGAPASDSAQAALVVIKDFWRRVWDRDMSTETDTQQYLGEFAEPSGAPQQWPAVTGGALCVAAIKQKHKAAGPDGWIGNEVFAFPLKIWSDLAPVFVFFEKIQAFPSAWSHIAQIHLAKEDGVRLIDGATPASRLRPISLMSVWWRIYCTARLRGDQEQQWLSHHLVSSQHGGRRNHDASSAFTELGEKFALGWYIGTLDLSKAFDFVTPSRAAQTLKWHGFPHGLADAIEILWSTQRRYLTWQNEVLPQPERVATSMPQGDSLSPRVLNLLLSTPTRAILSQEPETRVVVFIDDRSWASRTLASFIRTLQRWREHSQHLGFRENMNKSQFTHRDPQKRRDMGRNQVLQSHVVDNICVLGAHLGVGEHTRKEKQRLTKAFECASKVHAAPVTAAVRSFVATCAATAKASFGWLARAPVQKHLKKLETRLRRAGYEHRMASPCLIRIVLGHCQDVSFCAGVDAVMAVFRRVMKSHVPLQDWEVSQGPAYRIRRFLKSLGWTVVAPWEWHHEGLRKHFTLDPTNRRFISLVDWARHLLRESWRCFWWGEYLKSERHEVDDLQGYPYDERMAKSARDLAHGQDALTVGVLVGAFVSPGFASKIPGFQVEKCPWCDCEGFFQHVAWECPAYPYERPALPESRITQRLGWGCSISLQHLAKVRGLILEARY